MGRDIEVVMTKIKSISKDTKEQVLPPLWNASKIFINLFYKLTQSRRNLLLPILDRSVKDAALKSQANILLFGQDFGEKIKSAKSLERAVKDLAAASPIKRMTCRTLTLNRKIFVLRQTNV